MGREMGRRLMREAYMYTYGCFMLFYFEVEDNYCAISYWFMPYINMSQVYIPDF